MNGGSKDPQNEMSWVIPQRISLLCVFAGNAVNRERSATAYGGGNEPRLDDKESETLSMNGLKSHTP